MIGRGMNMGIIRHDQLKLQELAKFNVAARTLRVLVVEDWNVPGFTKKRLRDIHDVVAKACR